MPIYPRMCLSLHNPPKSYGDCIRACVATLTDDDNIPHVFDDREAEECWAELREYLATKGKFLAIFGLVNEHPFEFMKDTNKDVPYILLCQMETGEDHALLCKNDKIIHNPAYYKSAIKGPHSSGYWALCVIGNIV